MHAHRLAVVLFLSLAAVAQDAESRAQEHTLAALPQSRYLLLPPSDVEPGAKPANARGLLVVLPGGDGSAEFAPFVQNGIHAQCPELYVAQLVAPKWTTDQQIVWPTERGKTKGMRYPTEDYVRAVVADVQKQQAIDAAHIYLLVWSSSGPAAWATLLRGDSPFVGAYVAMSIWPKPAAAELARSKGLRVQLDQSPDDQTTKFVHARDAYAALTAAGAVVRVSTYRGGHGWQDDPLARLRAGLDWLRSQEPAPAPAWPAAASGVAGKNLLTNGSFEDGERGWTVTGNSGTLTTKVEAGGKAGKQALHLTKTGGAPLDLVQQEVAALPAGATATARAWVKTKGCKNAWLKCFLYRGDEVIATDVDLAQLRGDRDWQQVEKTWPLGAADRAVFQIVVVLGGEVWVDGCELVVTAAK